MQKQPDYKIHDVLVREVSHFDTQSKAHRIKRVTIYVGEHGPFTEDFGDVVDRPDTPASINAWKQEIVATLMAVAG